MKVMGYENFTVLQLPESRFFDDEKSSATRKLPMPSGLDLNKAQHKPLTKEVFKSSALSSLT